MRAISFDLYGQGGQVLCVNLHEGWNPIPSIHAGVWLWDGVLQFWNACPGAGELFLDRIEIDFDRQITGVLPRSNWSTATSGLTLRIGSGHEYMAPRACLTVRWAWPTRCPATAMYGPAKLSFTLAQKRDIFTSLAASLPHVRDTGLWAPFGDRQPDTPGGQGVGSLAGWEQDAKGFLLRHDLTMERMPIGRLDQQTGLPIRTKEWHQYEPGKYAGYTTDRGYTESTQLDEFTQHPANIYDAHRVPLVTWPGTCPYRDLMLGTNRSNSYLPYDKQHLERALIPVKAAVQCGDPAARFSLDMIAADCQAARTDTSSMPNGSRDLGWTIDAFAHSRATFGLARSLDNRLAQSQTASGALMQASYGYPFAPSCWEKSDAIQNPMPHDMRADAILERSISCHALALDNHLDAIKRALSGMPIPAPHFVGVADNNGPFPTFQHPCGSATWELWMAIGAGAALDPRGTWWHVYALGNATPGGKHAHSMLEMREILRAETVGMDQTAVLRCVLETLDLS